MSARRLAAITAGTTLVLHAAGRTGMLATPPLTADRFPQWLEVTPAPVAMLTLVRLCAEMASMYVLAVLAVAAVGHASGLASVQRAAHRAAMPTLRRALTMSASAGLAVASIAPPAVAATAQGSQRIRTESESGAEMVPRTSTASMTPADVEPHSASPPTSTAPPDQHTVERGESFWSIAADLVEARGGDRRDVRAVDPRWRALIEANRHRLADPDDPDLIFPGQVLVIPPAA